MSVAITRTFGLYGSEALNHRSELKILWDIFRSQIAELGFSYDRRIANDPRRSQKIEHGSIFCDRLRSRSQTITDDRRSVFPYDRRRSQNFLRSAIRDRLRSYGNQPLVYNEAIFGIKRVDLFTARLLQIRPSFLSCDATEVRS